MWKIGDKIFISYATVDSEYYSIKEISRELEKYPEIDKLFIWEEDTKEDILDYMEENIEKCDIFIIICTENSKKSDAVNMEWKTAVTLKRRVIPLFCEVEHIPNLLRSKLGVKFEGDIDYIVSQLYERIQNTSNEDLLGKYEVSRTTDKGFCIRCKTKIKNDRERPYCLDCYKIWAIYENPNYEENFCHECGKKYSATFIFPLCNECYYK